jgi:hypothetical protein
MRGVRVMVQLLHIAAGVMATLLIGVAARWAYPVGRDSIGIVTWVSALCVVLIGVKPLVQAWQGGDAHD